MLLESVGWKRQQRTEGGLWHASREGKSISHVLRREG
jgi:hypothetical protein